MKVSSERGRQAVLVNDFTKLDLAHEDLERLSLFDENGDPVYFTGFVEPLKGGKPQQVLTKGSDADYDLRWTGTPGPEPEPTPDPTPSPYLFPVFLAYDGSNQPVPHAPFPAVGLRLSDFPVDGNTSSGPFIYENEAKAAIYWFRVATTGLVVLSGTTGAGIDMYAYLYEAAAFGSGGDPAQKVLVAENDDGAGNAQPMISMELPVGDYIFVYTGYNNSQEGPFTLNLGSATTAVLAEDLTGPAPTPPDPPAGPQVVGGSHTDDGPGTITGDGNDHLYGVEFQVSRAVSLVGVDLRFSAGALDFFTPVRIRQDATVVSETPNQTFIPSVTGQGWNYVDLPDVTLQPGVTYILETVGNAVMHEEFPANTYTATGVVSSIGNWVYDGEVQIVDPGPGARSYTLDFRLYES